jgi:hypothetical protein
MGGIRKGASLDVPFFIPFWCYEDTTPSRHLFHEPHLDRWLPLEGQKTAESLPDFS